MKTPTRSRLASAAAWLLLFAAARPVVANDVVDPRTNSWLTAYAGKYARIYTNDPMKAAGNTMTNWSNGSQTQTNPAYCGVQEVFSSANWVYVRSTGLGSHIMGPWYLNTNRTVMFPNLPVNQRALWRFPRNPVPSPTTNQTSLGTIGFFVDGVAMFDSSDGFVWTGSAESGNGTGYWHREAYANEGSTFDPGYAHQENTGTHHYHANPIALRYLLGDHVTFLAASKTYTETTNAPTKHSPIVGWVRDGYPVYGPYAYSNAFDPNSPIIRMRTGYQLRNGSNGTDVLTNTARANLPKWAQRLYNTNSAGPSNFSTYPLARYMEDYAFLGDLTNNATGTNYRQGIEFDLDEHNGRYCVTPEFPDGTYAYFVSIDTNGTPKFPNNIGRTYFGDPVGGSVTAISETVVTNFLGNTNLLATLNTPTVKSGSVTLTWSALEGGSYQVEAGTNVSGWTVLQSGVKSSPNQVTAGYTNVTALDQRFYRVGRTAVATFDSAGSTLFATNGVAPGGSASRGQTVYLTITLPASPPNPPAGAPITSVTIGSITAGSTSYTTQGTVLAVFAIPAGYTPTGAQNVVVQFNPNPAYTLSGGFTINP